MTADDTDQQNLNRGRAAVRLADAAAELRNTEDALVAFGREGHDTSMPSDTECERALQLAAEVAEAHGRFTQASHELTALGGPQSLPSEGDGFRRVG